MSRAWTLGNMREILSYNSIGCKQALPIFEELVRSPWVKTTRQRSLASEWLEHRAAAPDPPVKPQSPRQPTEREDARVPLQGGGRQVPGQRLRLDGTPERGANLWVFFHKPTMKLLPHPPASTHLYKLGKGKLHDVEANAQFAWSRRGPCGP